MSKKLSIVGQDSHDHKGACATSGKVALNIAQGETHLGAPEFKGRAAVITLGCAKNQVDSEVMMGVLRNNGYELVSDVTRAEVAIVNTCGFLQSAVKESVDCILEVAEHKKTGQLRTLIVAGCLVERYRNDLAQSLPEVDGFVLLDDLLKVGDVALGNSGNPKLAEVFNRSARPYFLYDETSPREVASTGHMAYVKVSEGCNRPCTFCIIPKIRGGMRSRKPDSLIKEIQMLGQQGIKEVNLVAQDLTSYGSDLDPKVSLESLLRQIDASAAMPWVRLLYAYPIGLTPELLRTIVELPSVVNYLDFPLQHSSEEVLKIMKRPLGKFSPRSMVELVKKTAPELALRTTFITGFPGETEQDVLDLENFIREGHFTNVGIFTYSLEEGTPSFDLPNHISEAEKNRRREHLMLAQQEVAAEKMGELVGKELRVLVEGTHEDTDLLLQARADFQAPEVDGIVIINDSDKGEELPAFGSFARVRVTEVAGYDVLATYVGS